MTTKTSKPEMSRRIALKALVGAGLVMLSVTALVPQAFAQGYPNKPLRLIVPFPAGGTADAMGRLVAQRLGEALGQQVVVDNRPGAGGNVGAEAAAKAANDGYTLFFGTNGTHGGINAALYSKLNYDANRDFVPIALTHVLPSVLIINPNVPARTTAELIAWIKANPGKVNYASAGNGTTGHLAAELLKRMAGIEMTHVPYKGGAAAITDLIGGQVQLFIETSTNALAQARAGKVMALGVTSRNRASVAPELPPVADAVPGYDVSAWTALFAPAGTPREAVTRIAQAMAVLARERAYQERSTQMGIDAQESSPEHLAAFMQAEQAKWSRVVRESGAKVD